MCPKISQGVRKTTVCVKILILHNVALLERLRLLHQTQLILGTRSIEFLWK